MIILSVPYLHIVLYFATRLVSLLYVAITFASHATVEVILPIDSILAISESDSVYLPIMKYVR